MHIDLQTVSIKPLRHTFDNIARRIGADKPASRYMEGTMDLQPVENYHYRPTWEPQRDIFDETRTKFLYNDTMKLGLARNALRLCSKFGVFGVGRGAFESVYPKIRTGTDYYVYTNPENVIAQWLTEKLGQPFVVDNKQIGRAHV